MSEHNAVEEVIGFLIVLWLVTWASRVVYTGWQIFRYRGFSHFRGSKAEDFAEAHRTNYRKKWKKAAKAFGINVRKLKKMSKDEIKKMYRKKAMKHHPDLGGDPEQFRNLHEAYEFAYAA